MNIPFPTTLEQRSVLPYYMLLMENEGLSKYLIADIWKMANFDQGMFDLVEMWAKEVECSTERAATMVMIKKCLKDSKK